jgi:hypothetical protein
MISLARRSKKAPVIASQAPRAGRCKRQSCAPFKIAVGDNLLAFNVTSKLASF